MSEAEKPDSPEAAPTAVDSGTEPRKLPGFLERRRQREKRLPLAEPAGPNLAVERLTFCHHPLCEQGAPGLRAAVSQEADQRGLELTLETTITVCGGVCSKGPWLGIPAKGLFCAGLRAQQTPLLFEETLLNNRMIFKHLYLNPTKVIDSRVVWEPADGLIVAMEPQMCLVDVVAYLFWFNAAQSCGKCTPCRLGVPQVARLLNSLRLGSAGGGEVDSLEEIAAHMEHSAFCEFAGKVTEPLRVALASLRYEFQRHLEEPCGRHVLTGGEAKPDDPPAQRGQWASRPNLNRSFHAGVLRAYDPDGEAGDFLEPGEDRRFLLRPKCRGDKP